MNKVKSNTVELYIKEIAKHLREPEIYGYASVMVGAGFSKNAKNISNSTTMPDWSELATKMFEQLYPKPQNEVEDWNKKKILKTSGKNILKLAQEYEVCYGRIKLNKLIEENLSDELYTPGELHKSLLSLRWSNIFTTNYDTLLERTIPLCPIEKYSEYKIVTRIEDIPGSSNPRIVKLHGCIKTARDYIITEEDYRTYPQKYAPFVNTVQQAMLESALCLIGFSGDDPNFSSWLGWIRDNMGENFLHIYLCGVFNNMSETEMKVYDKYNVKVVDLSGFGANHTEALKGFFEELKNYHGNSWVDNYNESLLKISNNATDINKHIEYTSKLKVIREKYPNYITLPYDKVQEIKRYDNLDKFIDLKESFNKYSNSSILNCLYEYVWLREICCSVLYNYQAEILENVLNSIIIDDYNQNEISKAWAGIVFALLNMYLLDGREDVVVLKIKQLDSNINYLDNDDKTRLLFEKSKFYISSFDVDQAIDSVDKISDNASFEWRIKKALLYSQLNKKEQAKEILKKVTNEITQVKLSNDQRASLVGYINLCFRCLYTIYDDYEHEENNFSDRQYINHTYNTRNVINFYKDKINYSFLTAKSSSTFETKEYNPNEYTITKQLISNPQIVDDCFSYLFLFDKLALPIFSDHKITIYKSIEKLIRTSESQLWRWSMILRINDEKIINQFFTRIYIYKCDQSQILKLYEKLYNLYLHRNKHIRWIDRIHIISLSTISDMISRLALKLEYTVWIEFLKNFIKDVGDMTDNEVEYNKKYIDNVYKKFKFYMSAEIITEIRDELLLAPKTNCDPITLNDFIYIKNIETSEEKILDLVKDFQSLEDEKKRKVILKLNMVSESETFKANTEKIIECVWNNNNELPNIDRLIPFVWERLFDIKDVDFSKLYKEYILSYKLYKYSIHDFLRIFYSTLKYNNSSTIVDWNSEDFIIIIGKINDYINGNTSGKMDIFDEDDNDSIIRTYNKIADIIYFILSECLINNTLNDSLENEINTLSNKLKELKVDTISIYTAINVNKLPTLSVEIKNYIHGIRYNMGDNSVEFIIHSLTIILIKMEIDSADYIWAYKVLSDVIDITPYSNYKYTIRIYDQIPFIINAYKNKDIINLILLNLEKRLDILIGKLNQVDNTDMNTIADEDILELLFHISRTIYHLNMLDYVEDKITLNSIISKLNDLNLPEIRILKSDIDENDGQY